MSILEKLGIRRRSGRTPERPRYHDSAGRLIHSSDRVRSSEGWKGTVDEIKPWGVFVRGNPHFGDDPRNHQVTDSSTLTII